MTSNNILTISNILDKLSIILKREIIKYNKKALKSNFLKFKSKQSFENIDILEPGNEYLYEQYCSNNRIYSDNKCKRLRMYDIQPNNSALQEYKDKVEGGFIDKNNELLYSSLNNLLQKYESELQYSFNLTNKTVQDYLFTNTIIKFKHECKDECKYDIVILEELFNSGLNLFLKQMLFNHNNVRHIFTSLFSKHKEFMDNVINRLDNITYIEQKTNEWFAMRSNMISASICGYIDGYVSGAGISKEHEKIKEKSNITSTKTFSMSQGPLKHGILFEDTAGDIYDSLNNLISKEYGILPDYRYSCIGASPDGIITGINNYDSIEKYDVLSLFKYGRMREIKNPVSRNITNGSIPNYYYYQMQQQMYVCDLPYCDFIQTDITYPCTDINNDKSRLNKLLNTDKLDLDYIKSITFYKTLKDSIANYILNKINWWNGLIYTETMNTVLNMDVTKLEAFLVSTLVNNWNSFISIPLENLNLFGRVKGILWYYTKGYKDTLEYKYIWTPLTEVITQSSINNISRTYLQKWVDNGYRLEDKYYFTINNYMETEIVYNQVLYENSLERILKRWTLIEKLRGISNHDSRIKEYKKHYPMDNNSNTNNTKTNTNNTKTDTNNINTDTNNINTDTNNINTDTNNINTDTNNINTDTDTNNINTDTNIYTKETTESLLGIITNKKKLKAKLKTKIKKTLELVNVNDYIDDNEIYDLT